MTVWTQRTLGSLANQTKGAITDGPFGSNLTSAHYTESGPSVVRLQNIGDGVYKTAPAHISQSHFESLRKHSVEPGDLLVASLGENLPRACLAPVDLGPAIVKADCIRIRLADDVDPRFVMYALQRPDSRKWASEQIHGVGRPRLGLKLIRDLPVPVPPLDEQRRIVDILEDHLSRLDAATTDLRAASARTRRLVEADAISIVRGQEIDLSVASSTLRELARIGTGATPRRGVDAYWNGGSIPWVTSGELSQGLISTSAQRITAQALSETSVKLWPVGTLLVAMYGEGKTRGTVGELGIAATTNQACAAIVLHEKTPTLRDWVRLVLESRYDEMRRQASGGVQPNLNLSHFREMTVPLPGEAAISALIARHRALQAAAELSRRSASDAITRAAALRRALLAAAFSGRLTGRSSDLDLAEEMAHA